MGVPMQPDQQYSSGRELLEIIQQRLKINRSMLAAYLEVTEHNLSSLETRDFLDLSFTTRLPAMSVTPARRLTALFGCLEEARKANVPEKLLLNFMEEPFWPAERESTSLWFFVTNEPRSPMMRESAHMLAERFVRDIRELDEIK